MSAAEPSTPGCNVAVDIVDLDGRPHVQLRVFRDIGRGELFFDGVECVRAPIFYNDPHASFVVAREALYRHFKVLAPMSADPSLVAERVN
jgi:hypothetical protein